MTTVAMSIEGHKMTLYAATDDRVFLVEDNRPALEPEHINELLRECRWLFGPQQVIYLSADDDVWVMIERGEDGKMKSIEPYHGPIPAEAESWLAEETMQ